MFLANTEFGTGFWMSVVAAVVAVVVVPVYFIDRVTLHQAGRRIASPKTGQLKSGHAQWSGEPGSRRTGLKDQVDRRKEPQYRN
jgi:hypothetical protein